MGERMELGGLLEREAREAAALGQTFGVPVGAVRRDWRQTTEYRAKLAEALRFVNEVYSGRRRASLFVEAMTTAEFPLLFGDIIERQVLAKYEAWPVTWPAVARVVTVPDFKPTKLFPPVLGGDTRLEKVPEGSSYPYETLAEQAPLTVSVDVYGRKLGISWRTLVNDDLDMLKDLPDRLAIAARRTEELLVTEQYVDAAGPHAALYTAANKNLVVTGNGASTNNPPLTIAGLQDAFTVLSKQTDERGNPIMVEAVTLVVPPALEVTARNILSATELRFDTVPPGGTGAPNQQLIVANWMRNRTQIQVNPYISQICTDANVRDKMWFLFANPSVGRPALVVTQLRGHERPQILIKNPMGLLPGGGAVSPLEGDWETDSIEYRIRHVFGAFRIDGRATVASKGTGAL